MKSQDILILLKLILMGDVSWTIAELAESVKISASETHAAIKRSIKSGLFDQYTKRPRKLAFEEFLIHIRSGLIVWPTLSKFRLFILEARS